MPFPFSFGRYENRRRPHPLPGADGYSFAFTWQHRGEIVAAWHCLIGVPPCGAFRFCFLLACLLPVARHPPLPAARLPPRRMKTKPWHRPKRSEEHTSELQSLMRISYAVFCLKKKTKQTKNKK